MKTQKEIVKRERDSNLNKLLISAVAGIVISAEATGFTSKVLDYGDKINGTINGIYYSPGKERDYDKEYLFNILGHISADIAFGLISLYALLLPIVVSDIKRDSYST